MTRKAKALRTSLGKLREAADDVNHRASEEPVPKRPDPLYMRINREPPLYELARAVSYGGVRIEALREKMAELSGTYGKGRVGDAFTELTMTDPATQLTVLKPHVRKVCGRIMGPAPEDPYYERYWEGRTPPASHRPPVDALPKEAKPPPQMPAVERGTEPPPAAAEPEAPPPATVEVTVATLTPAAPARYDPSDEALAAFERLEGWLRGANEKPVDGEAEDTLRVLARALLEGKKGWMQAADARLQALQVDPPAYVPNKDLMAWDETLDDLLDRLHEVMLTPGMAR